MSRHQPPPQASSPYITAAGFAALQQEAKRLWKKRAEVTSILSAAAAEGDRSENAEYIYRKKQLREMDRRIRYLQTRLPILNVVRKVGNTEQVFFSAWVTLAREDGVEVEYRIVGGDEIDSDASKGYISVDSPLARGMLKKKVHDQVALQLGGKARRFCIKKIRYAD